MTSFIQPISSGPSAAPVITVAGAIVDIWHANTLGRHGNCPAHIHFFVSAPGLKHLTTQINLNGDEYLWDDFAFATREELIADPIKITDDKLAQERDIHAPHTEVRFNFALVNAGDSEEVNRGKRARVKE